MWPQLGCWVRPWKGEHRAVAQEIPLVDIIHFKYVIAALFVGAMEGKEMPVDWQWLFGWVLLCH